MAGTQDEKGIAFWKNKCHDQEGIIKTLSGHCIKVIKKHEELLVNFQKTQDQYFVLVKKLKEQKEQVKKARDVLVPVMKEYQEWKAKYFMAIRCQKQAETFASKVNSNNIKMKRQSQMLLSRLASGQNLVPCDFEEEIDDVEEEPKKYCESLTKKIKELSAEKASLSASIKDLNEDLDIEREKNVELKKRLEEYKKELLLSNDRINRQGKELVELAATSEEALKEYRTLQDQYEQELVTVRAANAVANQLRAENKAAKRQSFAAMARIGDNEKLTKALIELEELTTKYEADKHTHESQIKALEQELRDEKDKLGLHALEEETESLMKERDYLQLKLSEAEKLALETQTQHHELKEKYAELEEKYEIAMNKPSIPVPPPPPPPPPLPAVQKNILTLIAEGKKMKANKMKSKLGVAAANVNQDYNETMKELIEKGPVLRPVLKSRTQSLPEDNSAVTELEGILRKMKRAKSDEDLAAVDDPFANTDSELGKIFRKITQKNEGTVAEKPATQNASKVSPKTAPIPTPRKLSIVSDMGEDTA